MNFLEYFFFFNMNEFKKKKKKNKTMTSLNNLLKWAIENTKINDIQNNNKDILPKDKEWLDKVFISDTEKMKILIKILNENTSTIEEKEAVLEELEYIVQIIDNANDLYHPTINGLETSFFIY